MIVEIIRFFTVIICSFYVYRKLLNIKKLSKLHLLIYLAGSLCISFITYFLNIYLPFLMIPIIVFLSFSFITLMTKTQIELSITTTIISFSISYSLYTISVIVSSLIIYSLHINAQNNLLYSLLGTSLMQNILATIPFRIKRLNKGMPFLINNGAGNFGVMISVVILCAVMLFRNNNGNFIYIVPLIFIIICSVLVFLWWRSKLTNSYLQRLKEQEIQELHITLAEKEKRIKYLIEQNNTLAKIIHKDNKLIPSIILAVEQYLKSSPNTDSAIQENGENLLKELSGLYKERHGIIEKYQNQNKQLPLTGVFSIDTLFNYMLSKASNNNITFDLNISGSIKYMTEQIISEADLNTLLADLLENAIIATKKCFIKKIIVNIGIIDNYYFIDVIDSGISFEIATLCNLGIKKSTTHADEGGSGIGLFNTFELLEKYKSSFILKEFDNNDKFSFTKQLSIRFDNKHEYIIDSNRNNQISKIAKRQDLVLV